jgi:hypothetical protein
MRIPTYRQLEIELHILRHYAEVPQAYCDALMAQGVSAETIEAACATVGSKFSMNLEKEGIETPRALLQRIDQEYSSVHIMWSDLPEGRLAIFSFETAFPIGVDSLRAISTLSPGEKERITQVRRGNLLGDEVTVNSIKGKESAPTTCITVEIVCEAKNNTVVRLTAYPGRCAPDFPNDRQSQKDKEESLRFWSEHVFCV